MSEFDPYYKWLGIPRDEQPPNHYRLLGITVFETDPDVIEAAADRQMTYVSQCATGEHLKLSQRLLNELSSARVCLLVAAKKKVYDADLKAKFTESQRLERSMAPVILPEPQSTFTFPGLKDNPSPQPQKSRPKRRSLKANQSAHKSARAQRSAGVVAAIITALILGALGLRSVFNGRNEISKTRALDRPSNVNVETPELAVSSPVKPDPRVPPHVDENVANTDIPQIPIDGALNDDAQFLNSPLRDVRDAFALAKASRDKLLKSPDDSEANLAWGRFVCFYKQDWADGLHLMAKSDDTAWGPLARKELDTPATTDKWIELGDAWIQAGARESNTIQSLTAQRADRAWQRALMSATELNNKEVEQQVDRRIVNLFGKSFVVTKGDSMGATITGSDAYSPTGSFTMEFWVSTIAPMGTLLSKRHADREHSIIVHLHNGVPNLSIAIGAFERGGGGGSPVNDGKWHHIAIVKRSNEISLFVDGNKTSQTIEDTELASKSPWKFGCSHNRPSIVARFGGVRISKVVRYDGPFVPSKRHLSDDDVVVE